MGVIVGMFIGALLVTLLISRIFYLITKKVKNSFHKIIGVSLITVILHISLLVLSNQTKKDLPIIILFSSVAMSCWAIYDLYKFKNKRGR